VVKANSTASPVSDRRVTISRSVVTAARLAKQAPSVDYIMQNPLTALRFLERASSVHPDRTAIIDGFRTFTYAAMAAH